MYLRVHSGFLDFSVNVTLAKVDSLSPVGAVFPTYTFSFRVRFVLVSRKFVF